MYLITRNKNIGRLISAGLIFCLAFSLILPKEVFAGRSRAGGGTLKSYDAGDFALTVGMSLGSFVVGSAIGSAINNPSSMGSSFYNSLSNTFNSTSGFDNTMVSGYTTFAATTQVSRAASMAGSYYGWDPKATYLVSSVASGATAGFLNSSGALGDAMGKMTTETAMSTMAKGALVGGAGGMVSGGTIVAIDGDKINKGEKLGVGAQIAGMTGGILATNLTRSLFNPRSNVGKFERYGVDDQGNLAQADTDGKVITGGNSIDQNKTSSITQIAKDWTEQGIYDKATPVDVIKDHINKGELISYKNGEYKYYIQGEKASVVYTLSTEEAQLLNTATIGENNTVNLAVNDSGSYGFNRVVVGSFSDTLNQWPLIASNTLALLAADRAGDTWKPFAQGVAASVSAPLINSFADAYSLKPAYWGVDQKLGYVPVMQEQRDALIKKAGSREKFILDTVKQVARYDFPVALLSGGVESGLNKVIDNDNSMKAMLVSLGGVTAAGIARGVAMYAYNENRFAREEQSVVDSKGKKIDRQASIMQNLDDRAMIAQAIRDGDIKPLDRRRYEVEEVRLVKNRGKNEEEVVDKQKLIADVKNGLGGIDIKEDMPLDKIKELVSASLYNEYIGADLYKDIKKLDNDLSQMTAELRIVKETTDEKKGRIFAPDTNIKLATEFVIRDRNSGEVYSRGDEGYNIRAQAIREIRQKIEQKNKDITYTYDNKGQLVAFADFPYQISELTARMPASTIILGNLAQGLIEFGWQGFAMGLPYTRDNKMSAYAWNNYSQNLFSNSRAAGAIGITEVLRYNSVNVGKDIIGRSALMTLSDIPVIGNKFPLNSIAKYVPITGYKGLPFSVVAMIDKGDGTATGLFFKFPYYKLQVITNNIYAEKRMRELREVTTGEKNGNQELTGMSNLPNTLK